MQIAILSTNNQLPSLVQQTSMDPILITEITPDNSFGGYIIDNTEKTTPQLINQLKQEIKRGKPLLSLGTQTASLLAETGIIPGLENNKVGLTLEPQQEQTTYKTMRPATEYQYNAFTRHIKPNTLLKLLETPITNQFIIPSALLLEMQINGLDVFHYNDDTGKMLNSIAAVANKTGNVMAVLPQLESSSLEVLLQSMRDFIERGYKQTVQPLCYYPR